ncbi:MULTISPECIES: DUF2185 domain-containing protein [unclassified Spirosoma]|uniref:immunity protein Imm33 domain-containing protein n=1 Tax=unclassified Spirosoma TaxID=2621999 RepID=UPI000961BCC8|nr:MULTISPECIES: DUF2185 domain-containing protein [unclassified Spirosoma]MBN8823034.1 DUF2185 domain-containing protein [Spirosoma sp.]OJW73133.1 MAG: hypothetical protein BGO59_06475 [Spirosoma sp. 48-14]
MEQSWYLDDAVSTSKESKYTFYKPSQFVLNKLISGDMVKLRFAIKVPDADADAERMWVEIAKRSGDEFEGFLTNQPQIINDLEIGTIIKFNVNHIIDTEYEDPENIVEKYIDRCFVTNKVLFEGSKIGYLYREESLGEKNDFYDSGWRITAGTESQEYLDTDGNAQFVSLGAVLNVDDSIIGLLDEPTGSVFEWDDSQKTFVRI